jgi:hypothetical protein
VGVLRFWPAVETVSRDDLASRGPQGLPGPGQSTPPAAQVPHSRGPQGLPGPGPSMPPAARAPDAAIGSSDGGPGAAVIVLITLVGTLALTGVAYSATRFAHRRGVTT